tara:strand:- start:318 stop:506 length:189 start_codon:yes stop_codon:yes gene_type:complete
MSVGCPHCGYVHRNHTNVYGKICSRCGAFIEPLIEPPLIKERRENLKMQQEKIRNVLRRTIK